jgi:hypothetical protein
MTTYKTEVTIWSAIGNTPITKRNGAYCDELLNFTMDCDTPASAIEFVTNIIKNTEHASSGYFNLIDYPNQNTKNRFISI